MLSFLISIYLSLVLGEFFRVDWPQIFKSFSRRKPPKYNISTWWSNITWHKWKRLKIIKIGSYVQFSSVRRSKPFKTTLAFLAQDDPSKGRLLVFCVCRAHTTSGTQFGQLPSTFVICYRSAHGDCQEREFFILSRVVLNAKAIIEFWSGKRVCHVIWESFLLREAGT